MAGPRSGEVATVQQSIQRGMSSAQRAVIVVLVLLVLAAVTVLGYLVGANDAQASAEASAQTRAEAPTDGTPLSSLEDGRHAVYLTGVDADGGTVTFDTVRYTGGVVENDNPATRSLPVRTGFLGTAPDKIVPKAVYWITVEDRTITRIDTDPRVPA